ncbi:MAG: hypothetical protein Q8Q92_04150 [bacterium]|nr:hypothetical protein [bacterium]
MSLGLILQIVGGVLSIGGIMVGLVGIYISPQGDNVVNYFQNRFSETQTISSLFAGINIPGVNKSNDRLNLDNAGFLVYVDRSSSSDFEITLALDTIPLRLGGYKSEGFEVSEIVHLPKHDKQNSYTFDRAENRSHTIQIGNRKFVVKLLEIKAVSKDNHGGFEYIFGINEQ